MTLTEPALKAHSLLQTHWNGLLPVNPADFAMALNVALHALPTSEFSSRFYQDDRQKPAIAYNMSDALLRRRFAVAHALGHYVLNHRNTPPDILSNFSLKSPDVQERAANDFATALLMPADAMMKILNSGKMRSVEQFAGAFAVSTVSITHRLSQLGLA